MDEPAHAHVPEEGTLTFTVSGTNEPAKPRGA